MLRRRRLGVAVVLGALSVGCQEITPIEPGECGNQIIDPAEDCDGKVPSDVEVPKGVDVVCGKPGTARACRFDCAPSTDPGSTANPGCPTGYACGGDGICRAPSGEFELLASIPASPSHVLLGDFDGDGLSDLLSLDDTTGDIDVYFFERDGEVSRTFSIPSDNAVPAIGGLVADDKGVNLPTRDFTFSVQHGLGVMQGQADRTFVATAYASIEVPWKDITLVPLRVFKDDAGLLVRESFIGLHNDKDPAKGWGMYEFRPTGMGEPVQKVKLPIQLAAGQSWAPHLPTGNFAEDGVNSPCDELILVPVKGNAVQAVSPCAAADWNTQPNAYPPLALPSDTVKSALAVHLNPVNGAQPIQGRDNHLDLIIQGESGVYVAFGNGDGSFSSAPLQPNSPNVAAKVDMVPAASMPLAAADVNRDGAPDFVLPTGIFISKNGSALLDFTVASNHYYVAGATLAGLPWEEALFVDYNGDGLLDVVATSPDSTGVQLFTNVGNGTFNPELVPTALHASHFAIGDFDGDLLPDIAFRQGLATGPATMWVMFGQKGELPLDPRSLGRLPGVDQVVAGVNALQPGITNSISDLAVLTHNAATDSVAGYLGRTDKLLQAPIRFLDVKDGSFGDKVEASVIGRFHEGDQHGDIAAVVSYGGAFGTAGCPRLWLLRGVGAAQVGSIGSTGELCGSVRWERSVLAVLDVDGDGQDELIAMAPNAGPGASDPGALFVAKAGAGGAFDLGEMIPLPERLYDRSLDLADGSDALRNAPICLTDVDGDGNADIVMVSVSGGAGDNKTGVSILWGSGNAGAPFSGKEIGHVKLDGAEDERVRSIACTDGDGDAMKDVVIVTSRGTYLAKGAKDREIEAAALSSGRGQLPGGVSVASANIDADGLLDLAVSGPSGILVYRGKATNP